MFVEIYILCETFRCLPRAGALFDQDSYMMYGLAGVAKAFKEKEAMQNKSFDGQMKQMMSRARR